MLNVNLDTIGDRDLLVSAVAVIGMLTNSNAAASFRGCARSFFAPGPLYMIA